MSNNWASPLDDMNDVHISDFGQSVTFSPRTGAPTEIVGILQERPQAENLSPGVYAGLAVKADSFDSAPEGEITVGDRIYKILSDRTELVQGMYALLLRFDREVV